jgi:hypothetical protein
MEWVLKHENNRLEQVLVSQGTVWMVGVNIYPEENDLPLLFAFTKFALGCLDGGVNVDVDERGRAGPTTNLL